MSNTTNTDDTFALGKPIVLAPIGVAILLVVLLVIAVFLFTRNRHARIRRLRQRVELAESRVNALLKIQQIEEVKKGANEQSSDDINKKKDESRERIRDNGTIASVKASCAQNSNLSSQNIVVNQPATSEPHHSAAECNYGTQVRMNGHSVMGSSSESLDDASHIAVVDQSLYDSNTCRGYMRGEMRVVQNTDHRRPNNLFSMLNQGGYSSSEVEGWV